MSQIAGPVAALAVAPERQRRERADRVDRVHVAHDEDARLILLRMREARPHAVAEAHAAGDALDARAHQREVAGGEIHHPVHGGGVVGRAFALDPRPQPGEHGVGVEGQVGRVHRGLTRSG